MPTQIFHSPEAHAAAVQNDNLRIAISGKSCVHWTLSGLALSHVKAQWGQVGSGTLVDGTMNSGCVTVFVPTRNAQTMRMNGQRFDEQSLWLQMPGDEFCLSSTDWHCWFVMVIPNEVMAQWSGDGAAAIMPCSRMITIPSERAATLRRVVAQLGSIVQQTPIVFESWVVIDITARKLADSVREAIWGWPPTTTQPGRRAIPRRQIVRTAMDFIDQRGGKYLTVTDLASAASVSERTLRSAFQDYFGMGPVRYLKLRTLNLARQALQNADPTGTTVTRVATQFGVWELGRFARDYQLLFGELPSETLRRAH